MTHNESCRYTTLIYLSMQALYVSIKIHNFLNQYRFLKVPSQNHFQKTNVLTFPSQSMTGTTNLSLHLAKRDLNMRSLSLGMSYMLSILVDHNTAKNIQLMLEKVSQLYCIKFHYRMYVFQNNFNISILNDAQVYQDHVTQYNRRYILSAMFILR